MKLICIFYILSSTLLFSKDDIISENLKISLSELENLFFRNNYQLISANNNIDAAKSAKWQSQLWQNPNLSISQNIYNHETKKWFDFSSSGNTDIAIQQLIQLGGKKNELGELLNYGIIGAELQKKEITRNLLFQLRTNYYDLFFDYKSIDFYLKSIEQISSTIENSEKVYARGSMVISEILRLKSLKLILKAELQDILTKVYEKQAIIKTIIGDSALKNINIIPKENNSLPIEQTDIIEFTNDSLISIALGNRSDYLSAINQLKSEKQNKKYQEALSVPDLTVGLSWSRNGGYISDYTALSASIDIPVFNRNQGAIAQSEANFKMFENIAENIKLQIVNDVISAKLKAIQSRKLLTEIDKSIFEDYEKHIGNMFDNYQKRNVTIIEFSDFLESYRTAMQQIIGLHNIYIEALENINYTVGKDIIKFK